MNPQQLVAHALTRSVKLSRAQAAAILAHHGDGAAEQITRGGALIDLAGAMGRTIDIGGALIMLEFADQDYDLAAQRLIDDIRSTRQRIFNAEFDRLEKLFWAREAQSRHSQFMAEVSGGALGWQAAILLLAVEHAGLKHPDAKAYRKRLAAAVGAEMGRRFPGRREADWRVIDHGYRESLQQHTGAQESAHEAVVDTMIREEEAARRLVTDRIPRLEQQINALRSPILVRDVTRILDKMRKRLQTEADAEGWQPNIEAYRDQVLQAARDHALSAS